MKREREREREIEREREREKGKKEDRKECGNADFYNMVLLYILYIK